MEAIITPISNKAKSRIGKLPVTAEVQQVNDTQAFVVFPTGECRWIQHFDDPDFNMELST